MLSAATPESPEKSSPQEHLYAEQIQPILQQKCYSCHGSEKNEGGLRLDVRSKALEGGDSGPSLVAGSPEESYLLDLIHPEEEDYFMPPEGDRITKAEYDLIATWIEEGLPWPDEYANEEASGSQHWAFQSRSEVTAPQVSQQNWVRNAIDPFILARLEAEGIEPSPEADRAQLMRRLSLDLLGLVPTPEEVEVFLNDKRPDAYARLVDQMLASPHFGERWGRHWLDLARYADSDGYEKDRPRPYAYRYRDWVIEAINDDMPFDQFTIEQLAGDLLPNPSLSQKIATGFHRNTLKNREGGVDQEEFRNKEVVDRVSTTGQVWLGLTVGCAECHSHKYDPISQKEFYGLFAFFNNADEEDISAPIPTEQVEYEKKLKKYNDQLKKAEQSLAKKEANYRQGEYKTRLADWLETLASTESPSIPARFKSGYSARTKEQLKPRNDGTLTSLNNPHPRDNYFLEFLPPENFKPDQKVTGFEIEVLPDPSLKNQGPGNSGSGNFVITFVQASMISADGERKFLRITEANADYSQTGYPPMDAFNNNAKKGWAIKGGFGEPHTLVGQFKEPQPWKFTTTEDGEQEPARLSLTIRQDYGNLHTVGAFRVHLRTDVNPAKKQPVPFAYYEAAKEAHHHPEGDLPTNLVKAFERTDERLLAIQKPLLQLKKKAPQEPDTKAQTMIAARKPRETHVHLRGDFLRKGPEVEPHTPEVLPELEASSQELKPGAARLTFAEWIVQPDHPLTARVISNRIWQHLFGFGLVRTVDDFGTRGERPTHPELLDWLANHFVESGWSRKELIRTIVMSAAYRQSSAHRPELEQSDPENRLLARQNRFRLEAEIVRDLFLSSSGLLYEEIGGPSIFPPLPADVAALGYANQVKWKASEGDDRYRRGMYIFFQRTVPYPMLMTFDAPDTNVTCLARERSNTPLQALTLLNDPVFHEAAQSMAQRVIENRAHAPLDEQLRYAFRMTLVRQPDDFELQQFRTLWLAAQEMLSQQPEAAQELWGASNSLVEEVPLTDAASWVVLCRTLLNLDEFITRE
ncbi:Planctomycete cytochrome C [Planctomycetales bacterium 10988]|nr:Planctomycete cytochrome C [Planctomycetales bacterium 10988]